MDNMMHLRN